MQKVMEFELARDCLRYFVNKFGIKQMYIPYYLCDVVRHTLVDEGCKPIFYHIDDNFYPAIEFSKEDFILYPNYFGICVENVEKLVSIYSKLIVDNAHAYYDKPQGFACFNAGHKFGQKSSCLWIDDANKKNKQEISDNIYPNPRIKKFLELHKKYSEKNQLQIDTKNITAPFVYPYLAESIEAADSLAKNLQKEGKTIYRYWNPLPENYNEYKFYSRLVPIPLD